MTREVTLVSSGGSRNTIWRTRKKRHLLDLEMAPIGKDLDNFSASRTIKIIGAEPIENYTVILKNYPFILSQCHQLSGNLQ